MKFRNKRKEINNDWLHIQIIEQDIMYENINILITLLGSVCHRPYRTLVFGDEGGQ